MALQQSTALPGWARLTLEGHRPGFVIRCIRTKAPRAALGASAKSHAGDSLPSLRIQGRRRRIVFVGDNEIGVFRHKGEFYAY